MQTDHTVMFNPIIDISIFLALSVPFVIPKNLTPHGNYHTTILIASRQVLLKYCINTIVNTQLNLSIQAQILMMFIQYYF